MFSAWSSSAKSRYDCCQLVLLWGSVVCGGCSSIFIQLPKDPVLLQYAGLFNKMQQFMYIIYTQTSVQNYALI